MLSERNKFHMVLRSHGKRSTVHFVPEEILFNILILLPAEMLYDVVRYVCRKWYAMIQDPEFVSAHLSLSTTNLLRRIVYMSPCGEWVNTYQLLDVKDSCANVTHFKFVLREYGRVCSTCHGLVLLRRIFNKTHYIGNPITRKLLALPKLSSSMRPYWSSLVVSASSKLYKVLLSCDDKKPGSDSLCAILTVGVDQSWRVLDFTYLNLQRNFFLNGKQVVISGYVYWIPVYEKGIIYALDVDSEIVKRIALPYQDTGNKVFLPKGNSISSLIYYPDLSMDVWVLKDTRNEEWVKFGHIEGEPMRNEWVNIQSHYKRSTIPEFIDYVRPIFWLGNGEKILFGFTSFGYCGRFDGEFFVYDFYTHTCSAFDKKCDEYCNFIPFRSSLAWV